MLGRGSHLRDLSRHGGGRGGGRLEAGLRVAVAGWTGQAWGWGEWAAKAPLVSKWWGLWGERYGFLGCVGSLRGRACERGGVFKSL